MDPTLLAQGGLAVALAMCLVAIPVLWKQLLKVHTQRDVEREVAIPALLSATEMVKAVGDQLVRNQTHNEDRDRELAELRAEVAGYRRGRS